MWGSLNLLKSTGQFLLDNINALKIAAGLLIAGFAGFKIITTVIRIVKTGIQVFKTVKTVITTVRIAMLALNLTMLASL